jgi:uncharacterized protein YprB with RNaseH-like and TPR domain
LTPADKYAHFVVMLDDNLRRRLEALNRGPMPPVETPRTAGQVGVVSAPIAPPLLKPGEQSRITAASGLVRPVPGLLRRGEVVETPAGAHLRVRLPLDELWPGGSRLTAARQAHLKITLEAARAAVEPRIVISSEFAAFADALPDRTVVLDLETCGLAGSALFLVGILRAIDGGPCVEMLVARNYTEEPAVLSSLWHVLARHDVLVTFNGKTFDWPMTVERSIRHRLAGHSTSRKWTHIDILHHARRRWRKQLPNCRLLTLEQAVCRRKRVGDVPGKQIPSIYAEYVRTGFEREMDAVLFHNAVDLMTEFDLALRLAG